MPESRGLWQAHTPFQAAVLATERHTVSDELDDEIRASAWRERCPDITEAEIDALDPIEKAHHGASNYTGPAIMLAAYRAGSGDAMIDEGYLAPGVTAQPPPTP